MHRVLGGGEEEEGGPGAGAGAGASSSSAAAAAAAAAPGGEVSPERPTSPFAHYSTIPDPAAAAAAAAEAEAEAAAAAAAAAAALDADAAEGRQRARQARLASSLSGLSGGGSQSRLKPVAEDRAATPAGATIAAAGAGGGPFGGGGKGGGGDNDDDGDGGGDGDGGADDIDARLLALADEPHFAPFVRQDAYGQGGAGPWTWGERARLAGCALALVPLRLLVAALCVGAYYATCRAAAALPPPRTPAGQAARRTHLARAGRFWSRACLLALGFWRVRWLRVAPDGARTPAGPPWRRRRLDPAPRAAAAADQQQQRKTSSSHKQRQQQDEYESVPPPAVVANHLSWLDILLVMSRYFPSFVAREGTQDLPLIGLISRQMQCLYVDRERRGQQQQGQQQPQEGAAAAANGGSGGQAAATGSSVSAAVRARMRRAAARTGLLEAMMDAEDDAVAAGGGLARASSGGAAAAAAATDNADDAGGDAAAERPMLLFPEGTTSNGRYLLPFRTGAFLAGVPVRPVVISYSSCGGGLAGGRRPGGVLPRRRSRGGGGGGKDGGKDGGGALGGVAPDLELDRYCDTGGGSGGGRLSLAWESITAATHVLLVLASPWQSATCLELPLYVPSADERADARLFASRVRGELLRATALLPSDSGLEEKREYQQRLREVLAARDAAGRGK